MTPSQNPADAENLRQQVAALTHERDLFKKLYLSELAKNLPPVDTAEVSAAVPTGPWFAQFIARLRAGDPGAMDSWPASAHQLAGR